MSAHLPSTPQNFIRQTREAAKLFTRYQNYARSIGCTIFQDEIQADQHQSKLLNEWWEDNTR